MISTLWNFNMEGKGEIISDVKHSEWFVLKFAFPHFSPPLPSVVQI